jgi:hypothetical protein
MQGRLFKNPVLFHGGELAKGKQRKRRPLCRKRALHLVLKTRRGLFKHRLLVLDRILLYAHRNAIRIYDYAPNRDHVHVVLKIPSREAYVRFIRALTGALGRILGRGLFTFTPFTRVMAWGRAYKEVRDYLARNREEATGLAPYQPRRDWYRRWRIP